MARELLEKISPEHWDSGKPAPNSGFQRVRWLQQLNDLVRRPVANRGTASTNATAVVCNGAVQSTGIGLAAALQPKRYAEFTVKARVTFNINSAGPAFVYVYRTLGSIPANGAPPNGGDVVVAGDAFFGGPTSNGVNQSGAFSFLDTGLDVTKSYLYYLAVKGPNGTVHNLVNNSQLFVLERANQGTQMEVRIATLQEISQLSQLSISLGNIPFLPGQCLVALLEHDKEIVGFAATQNAQHAAGSWVHEKFRRKGYSYQLRQALDQELRRRGYYVYFALPRTDFEKHLFAKYGTVTEQLAQIRHL